MKIEREKQKAQNPKARAGDNQKTRVSTHEGSQLNKPKKAGIKQESNKADFTKTQQ